MMKPHAERNDVVQFRTQFYVGASIASYSLIAAQIADEAISFQNG